MAFGGYGAEIVNDFALVPDMVAGSKDVGSKVEEVFGKGRCQPEASGSVFCIYDHEVDLAFRDDVGQMLPHHPPSWARENVPDKEQFHREMYLS
jgi:hypothetical protein